MDVRNAPFASRTTHFSKIAVLVPFFNFRDMSPNTAPPGRLLEAAPKRPRRSGTVADGSEEGRT
jgi:hypothetical protein